MSVSPTCLEVSLLSLVEEAVQLVVSFFSAGIIPYTVVALLCLWKKVSSVSSYAAIQ